jgi:hypothetical protein
MSKTSPFVRKIIYIALIGALLIPLSLVSRPETRNEDGNIEDSGGQLSRLREQHSLSQAKLGEIDPASETMKLASLGLRGVAVNMLWMQAMDHKKKERYDKLNSTLRALTKIQPNFVKVWEFQAHNLAYNVSMEFDDYEYRYHWVKKGIGFLKEGVPYNKTDHRMTDNLGFFTGNKMGKSDEKASFRRMFRQDNEFHTEMSDYILPEKYDTRSYGPDSWKMAYHWYDYSRTLVVEQSHPQRISDMMFYMKRPAQLRNQAMSLQTEYRTDEVIQDIWETSNDEWLEYGEEEISNTLGITITLEGMADKEKKLEKLRADLDELAPGIRTELVDDLQARAQIPAEEIAIWKLPVDQRNDEQSRIARRVNDALTFMDGNMDLQVAQQAKPNDQLKAKRIAQDINRVMQQMKTIDKDSGTINYIFWKARTGAESQDLTVRARQALFDAQEMQRRSIYDDEFDRDYRTKEVTITKRGAISLYLDAFSKWHDVLELYPDLENGPMADRLADSMEEFKEMLSITNRDWPEDFPLQDLVDYRASQNEPDELPTSEDLEDMMMATGKDRELDRQQRLSKKQRTMGERPKQMTPDQDSAMVKGFTKDEEDVIKESKTEKEAREAREKAEKDKKDGEQADK